MAHLRLVNDLIYMPDPGANPLQLVPHHQTTVNDIMYASCASNLAYASAGAAFTVDACFGSMELDQAETLKDATCTPPPPVDLKTQTTRADLFAPCAGICRFDQSVRPHCPFHNHSLRRPERYPEVLFSCL